MSKKYEEMTIEELGKEADKILNKFKKIYMEMRVHLYG